MNIEGSLLKITILGIALFLVLCVPLNSPALEFDVPDLKIGYVEYTDTFTNVAGLSEVLAALEEPAVNLTSQWEAGDTGLSGIDLLIIGSFVSNSEVLNKTWDSNAEKLKEFVRTGGVVIVLTQADQDRRGESFLPEGIKAERSDSDYDKLVFLQPDHHLFLVKNILEPPYFEGWKVGIGRIAWETFDKYSGFSVIAAYDMTGTNPAIMEATWGKGRALLLAMAPDKAFLTGNDAASTGGKLLIENLLVYSQRIKKGRAPEVVVTANMKSTGYRFPIKGRVFKDVNANGVQDQGEPGLKGIGVSDSLDVVLTDENGDYMLANEHSEAKIVYISQPAGYKLENRFYQGIGYNDEDKPVNFPLVPDPKADGENFSFVQTTDIHLYVESDLDLFLKAIGELNELENPPDFVMATGDLVSVGREDLYKLYEAGVESSKITWMSVFGNHDANKGVDRALMYRKYLGPDYYSFDMGQCHIVVLNSVFRSPKQDDWLKKDMELLGPGKTAVFFQHYAPNSVDLEKITGYSAAAVFSGHWHSSKIVKHGDTLNINSPTFMMGGIDNSGAGFRVINIHGDRITTTWRYHGQEMTAEIVSPAESLVHTHDEPLEIITNLYDTNADVQKAGYKIKSEDDNVIKQGELSQTGTFSWEHHLKSGLDEGHYDIEVTAHDGHDHAWGEHTAFHVSQNNEKIKAKPGKDWPVFMGNIHRTGRIDSNLKPPFKLLWSHPLGVSVDLGSPVYANGRVFIGLRDRDGLEKNGVIALDVKTGKKLWFTKTDSSVNHSPAYADGYVYAASMGGKIYCFKARSGKPAWTYDLGDPGSRWILSAPVVNNKVLYAGSSAFMAALNTKTGEPLWTARPGRDWISSYSSPTLAYGKVYLGSMWQDRESLYALNGETGKLENRIAGVGMHGSASVYDGKLYFVDSRSTLHVVDTGTDETVKELSIGEGWSVCTPAVDNKLVVVSDGAGTITALDKENLETLWKTETGPSVLQMSPYRKDWKGLTSSPLLTDELVYIGGSDGFLYALDRESGEIVWRHSFGLPMLSTPAITGNLLLVGSYDGHVYAFAGSR